MRKYLNYLFITIPITGVFLHQNVVLADPVSQMELTTQLNIVGSNGKPTNDLLGIGVVGHYRLGGNWYAGAAIDITPSFDFEHTARIVGIEQDSTLQPKAIDAVGSSTMLTAFIERRMPNASGSSLWFWNLGAGFNSLNIDDVSGPVQGGGTFDITTRTNTELVLTAGIGLQKTISENWAGRIAFSATRHAADWKVRDRNTGNSAVIDTYTIAGIRSGITYRF